MSVHKNFYYNHFQPLEPLRLISSAQRDDVVTVILEERVSNSKDLCCDLSSRLNCSVDSILNFITCLIIPRTCFYHRWPTARELAPLGPADLPCSCAGDSPYRTQRWLTLVSMSIPLPCLLLYWPFRALLSISQVLCGFCRNKPVSHEVTLQPNVVTTQPVSLSTMQMM